MTTTRNCSVVSNAWAGTGPLSGKNASRIERPRISKIGQSSQKPDVWYHSNAFTPVNSYNLLIRKQRRAVEAAAPAAISGNPQIGIDGRGSPRNAANEDYENDVELEDEEEDLEEEADDEYEEGEESQIERPDRPVQTSLNPSVDSFVQTLENGGDNMPRNTLDYAGIESYFLDFGDLISNPQSPMALSSNIKDGLDGWDSNPEQFMPLSGFVRVTHLQLAQAVGKCSEWLVQNVGELRRPWRDESGASRKGPPIALLMESDVGILFHLFAFMTLGVPVSWRGHVIICLELTDHRSCYCLPVSAQPQSPICSPKHQPVLS